MLRKRIKVRFRTFYGTNAIFFPKRGWEVYFLLLTATTFSTFLQTKEEVVESQAEEAAHDENTEGEGDENTNAENGELVDTGIDQESKGIRQWAIN